MQEPHYKAYIRPPDPEGAAFIVHGEGSAQAELHANEHRFVVQLRLINGRYVLELDAIDIRLSDVIVKLRADVLNHELDPTPLALQLFSALGEQF